MLLAGLACSSAAAPISSVTGLLPEDQPTPASGFNTTDGGHCACDVMLDSKFVFYNRIPKCGSTTMVTYMSEAAQEKGWFNNAQWTGFTFIQSEDFDGAHFHQETAARRQIAQDMLSQKSQLLANKSHDGKVVFQRHIHYIGFKEFGYEPPVYLNLLRDPAHLRSSSFYFFRECVCNQEASTFENGKLVDYADEWCKSEWWRKSASFCSTDINSCYQDLDACREHGHSLGGSTLTDFICGHDSPCDDPWKDRKGMPEWDAKFQAKLDLAVFNLRAKYHWAGILEQLQDSMALLSVMLPSFFGKMDPAYWAHLDVAPDGTDNKDGHDLFPNPNENTKVLMLHDPYFRMEDRLYATAKEVLGCKLRACGLTPGPSGDGSTPSSFLSEVLAERRLHSSKAKVQRQ